MPNLGPSLGWGLVVAASLVAGAVVGRTGPAEEMMRSESARGLSIAAGLTIDGIPESLALDLTIAEDELGVALLAGIVIGNLVESYGAAQPIIAGGRFSAAWVPRRPAWRMTTGQVAGGPLADLALLAPRGRGRGDGPNDFPVNKTFAAVNIPREKVGPDWRLLLQAGDVRRGELTRDDEPQPDRDLARRVDRRTRPAPVPALRPRRGPPCRLPRAVAAAERGALRRLGRDLCAAPSGSQEGSRAAIRWIRRIIVRLGKREDSTFSISASRYCASWSGDVTVASNRSIWARLG